MKKQRRSQNLRAIFAKSRYVVLRSTRDSSLVAYGNDLGSVLKEADHAGVDVPFVLFPHDPSKRYIY